MSLQVPKKRVFLTVDFVGDKRIRGNIFLSPQSGLHYGEERIIDMLNDATSFFPFELEGTSAIRIINKENIISVGATEDLPAEEGLGKKETITVVLSNGRNISGELIIDQPEYKSRVLDFFNSGERRFFRLFTESETYYINISHVIEVAPS
jgi:hypothetical protein